MYAPLKYLIAGSALTLAGLPALATEEAASAVAPEQAATAVVRCMDTGRVPVTADEAQALPLRLVGFVGCGDRVAILADHDGYTLRIRANNGQEGYVARMYLNSDSNAVVPMTKKAPASSAHVENGIARWAAGAPGCDEFVSHGRHVESIIANGITVQVSVQDSGWKYRANVAVSNQSHEAVSVLPGTVTLDELTPNLRSLYAVDSTKLAHTPTHQVLWTVIDAVPSRSAVADYSGNVSDSERLANRTSPAPDYLNPRLELASARRSGFDRSEPIDVQSIALKNTAVLAGQITAGVMWFERDSSAHELSLRVPVGDMVFDFPFSFEQKK
jgi:hypothetical protein